jgi:hypothetical protein
MPGEKQSDAMRAKTIFIISVSSIFRHESQRSRQPYPGEMAARRPQRQGRPPGRLIIDVIEIAYYDGYECSVAIAYARRFEPRLRSTTREMQ